MNLVRYSRWDGTQDPLGVLPEDEIVSQIAEDVLEGWGVDNAIRRLLERGLPGHFDGLRRLRERLDKLRRLQQERAGMPDPLSEIRESLEEIKKMERDSLAADPSEEARFQELNLDTLPENLGEQIRALQEYQWSSPQADAAFSQLLDDLRGRMLDTHFRQISQSLKGMTPEEIARLKDMISDLNRMAEQRAEGTGPSQEQFDQFMDRHGDFFPEKPKTFDELLEALARRAMAMSRFMASLDQSQRNELESLMAGLTDDLDLAFQLDQLGANLRALAGSLPWDKAMDLGGEPVGLGEGLDLIDATSRLEELQKALAQDYPGASLEDIDLERLRRSMGEGAARDVERLRKIEKMLEDAGVVSRSGGRLNLTPRGVRKLGERALARVFEGLTDVGVGSHELASAGGMDEPTGSSRPWSFGDPFRLDLQRTLSNAVLRQGPGRSVKMHPDDFEVAEAERRTRVATVVLLDMSRSMPLRGHWIPAKRMALALHTLISTTYPEDHLSVIGFSDYAREMRPVDLAEVDWEPVYGTNMEHAFNLAGRILAKQGEASMQVLLVTDGEPTAHLEGDDIYFQWPPARETLERTYKEAMRLARLGATMNIFMLEQSPGLLGFVDRLARIVNGRVFSVSDDELGAVVLRDYVRRR
jgi:uncharacterized protein with von Willebrand factor type A (vWA) domain